MNRYHCGLLLGLMSSFTGTAFAFNEPPDNFGSTTFLDGGPVSTGLSLIEYSLFIRGERAVDKNGNEIPGGAQSNTLVQLSQLFYLTPFKFLGANLGFDFVLPLAAPTVKGNLGPVPLTNDTAGVGDISVGPALQWNDGHLFGRPFPHRFETYMTVPSGSYDRNFSASPGSNILTIVPYYSFTWYFSQNWETSWRFLYMFNGTNDATQVRAGQMFHLNYAFSRAVSQKLRLGVSGYFLQQMSDDHVNGVISVGSKERAFAMGPGLVYLNPDFTAMLSYPFEFLVQNRFRGSRIVLQIIHHF